MLGIPAEDYANDQVLDDVNLLYTGVEQLPPDFWEHHVKSMDSWKAEGRTYYRISGPDVTEWYRQPVHLQRRRQWLRGHSPQ